MTPERGERVTILWPGGPHGYVIEFAGIDVAMGERLGAAGGWVWMRGAVIEPARLASPRHRVFYVGPAEKGAWTLVPMVLSWTG